MLPVVCGFCGGSDCAIQASWLAHQKTTDREPGRTLHLGHWCWYRFWSRDLKAAGWPWVSVVNLLIWLPSCANHFLTGSCLYVKFELCAWYERSLIHNSSEMDWYIVVVVFCRCHVFAGCLTEKGEDDLRKQCSSRLKPVSMNVADHDSVLKAYDTVKGMIPQGRGLLFQILLFHRFIHSPHRATWLPAMRRHITGRVILAEWIEIC